MGEVIGVRGTTVAEIMRRSGCRIHIIQETSGEAQERKVVYNGTAAQMAEAKALVQSVINDGMYLCISCISILSLNDE